MTKRSRKKPEELMKSFTVRMPEGLLEQLSKKAGTIPISVVIRRLIEKYIKGEVGLD